MCGIAGVIDLAGRPVGADALLVAQQALLHRGPDDRGIRQCHEGDFFAGLVHTRLAVLDLSPAGHQPFADATGRYHITYNGEVYNFAALRRELAGRCDFRTQCDTEVLLAMLIEEGVRGLARLNGMWAFAFVDTATRTGFLARDRFGKKPLYYAALPGAGGPSARLVFASEMRALLPLLRASDARLEVDREALRLYLALGFIPHPLTIFRGVHKLPPGHVLEFDAAAVHAPRRYYRIPAAQAPAPDYPEAQAELRRRIAAAVNARRIADVPLGAFLSGGLDSAVVVAELAAAAGAVRTFSIGYSDQAAYDETRYARLVADRFGTEHHEFRLTFGDVLDAIPTLLDHLAEPFADSSLIPTSLVSRATRRHVTVALSGDGGDELFGGYWRYRGHHYLSRYRRLPRPLRRWLIEPLLSAAPSAKSSRLLNRVRQARKLLRADAADPFERHAAWSCLAEPDVLSDLIPDADAEDLAGRLRRSRQDIAPGQSAADELTPLLLADLAFSLPADMLSKVDTASMLHALEVRVPFLDPDVVEFVAGLPITYKCEPARPDGQKRILRDAYRDRLPAEILTRPKMGFEVPVGEFLRRELRDMYRDIVRADTLRGLGIDPATAERLWEEHAARRHERADILYALLVLCWWRRRAGSVASLVLP